jgi:hypothetical protein
LTNTLQTFAKDFDANLKRFEMGDKQYFYNIDETRQVKYIFEVDPNISPRRVDFILKKIKRLYDKHIINKSLQKEEEIKMSVQKVKNEIKILLKNKDLSTEEFLKKF